MFSLSEKITKSMWNTAALLKFFEENQNAILQYEVDSLNEKHQEMLEYFGSLVAQIGNRDNRSFSPSIKRDITGYFKSLVKKFNTIPQHFQTFALSPKKYCEGVYGAENAKEMCKSLGLPMVKENLAECVPMCKSVLTRMFVKTKTSIEKLEADKAFVHLYLNYNHLDFTYDKIFPASSSSSSSVNNTEIDEIRQFTFRVMVAYFTHLMDVADTIVLYHTAYPKLFPTVEEYCRDAAAARSSN